MKQQTEVKTDAKTVANDVAMAVLPLAKELVDPRQVDDLLAGLRRLNRGIFRLVVMGEIKKGKSSFINALLGEPELLPTSSDIATSTVFKLIYGPKRKNKVFFLPDPESGDVFPAREVSRDELVQYGTEDGNPGNEKRVDFIGIEIPNPLLETGLVIVDTPGVGGLFKAHRDITWRFAPNADGIIFVLDSVESVISADEIEFLKDLTAKYTKRLFFVQTKIDNASEDLWKSWEVRNKSVLQAQVGLDPSKLFYFPLSAKLKNTADKISNVTILERSGYLPLVHFLNGKLIPSKEAEIAGGVARKLLVVAEKIAGETRGELDLCNNKTVAELKELEADRRAIIDEFTSWEKEVLNQKLNQATAMLARARRDAFDRIEDLLNPSGRLLLEFLERHSTKTGKEIQQQVEIIQQNFMELCGAGVGHIFDDFVIKYSEACADVTDSLRVASSPYEIAKTDGTQVDVDYRKVKSLTMSASSGFETVRNVAFGGLAGVALTTAALNVASIAFPPLAALNFVVWAGGLYGAGEVKRVGDERRKDEAMNKLRGLLSEQLSQIRKSVLRHFEDKAEECTTSLNAIFKSAAEQTKADLERRLDEVKAAGVRTKEEAKTVAEELESKLKVVESALVKLKTCTTPQRG